MGLQKDLKMSDKQFYNVVMIFCKSKARELVSLNPSLTVFEDSGYLACIFMGNLSIRKLGPRIVLGFAVTTFGVFVCCMSKARSYGDLIGLRFGIGAAEALLQSAPLYLSIWYGRDELGKRIGNQNPTNKMYKCSHADFIKPFSILQQPYPVSSRASSRTACRKISRAQAAESRGSGCS